MRTEETSCSWPEMSGVDSTPPAPANAFRERLWAMVPDRSKTDAEIAAIITSNPFILSLVARVTRRPDISAELSRAWRYETLELIRKASQKKRGLGCNPHDSGFTGFWRQVVERKACDAWKNIGGDIELARDNGKGPDSRPRIVTVPDYEELPGGGPARRDEARDVAMDVRAALESLPELWREVVTRRLNELTYEKIGQQLGLSVDQVRSAHAKAQEHLRVRLRSYRD